MVSDQQQRERATRDSPAAIGWKDAADELQGERGFAQQDNEMRSMLL